MGGYQGGASASTSSGTQTTGQYGQGDVFISTGGQKQSQTLFIVVGVVAVAAALMAILFLGRGRR